MPDDDVDELRPGLRASVEREVTADMTAVALGSGDVPVLGSPAVLALAEQAAVAALSGHIGVLRTSVGSRVELHHLAPTLEGVTVTATAHLVEVAGRKLTFDITVVDPAGEVADIRHTRVVVARAGFLETAEARRPAQPR